MTPSPEAQRAAREWIDVQRRAWADVGDSTLRAALPAAFDADERALAELIESALQSALSERDQLKDLLREVHALKADAERYRHMRASAAFRERNGPGLYWYLPRFTQGTCAERLDQAIDFERRADSDDSIPVPGAINIGTRGEAPGSLID